MITVRSISDLRALLTDRRNIGLVPTMGAFHKGHLALMHRARAECDTVVVSLYVNPIQFNDPEDLRRYPRNEEADIELAQSVGTDILWAPTPEEMRPEIVTRVLVPEVGDRLEGEFRPGHFAGVATIVLKLFHCVEPQVAYFGLKDLQQCAVIRRMCEDLDVDVDLRWVETVREPDGLAMSSRNQLLSPTDRQLAASIFRELSACAHCIRSSKHASHTQECLDATRDTLRKIGFQVDYICLVDPITMRSTTRENPHARIVIAARLGGIRLIDNVPIFDL